MSSTDKTTNDGYKLIVNGHSGLFQLIANDLRQSSIRIKMDKLEEIGVNGTVVKRVNTFSNQVFSISGLTDELLGTSSTWATSMNASLSVQNATVPFIMKVYLITSDGEVEYGGNMVALKANTVKFELTIENWPFSDRNNQLRFGVNLLSVHRKDMNILEQDSDLKIDNSKPEETLVKLGKTKISIPKIAIINVNETGPVSTSSYVTGNNTNVQWLFPYFNSKLFYDPTIEIETGTVNTPGASLGKTYDDYTVSVNGQSGSFKIEESKTSHRFIQFRLAKISENNGSHIPVQAIQTLADQNFLVELDSTSQSMINDTFDEIPVYRTSLSTNLNVNNHQVPFRIDIMFFKQDGTFDYAGELWNVGRGQMKFNVSVQNWPFLSASNTLSIEFNVLAKNSDGVPQSSIPIIVNDENSAKVQLNDIGKFILPNKAILDGTVANITVSSFVQGPNTNLKITCPAFQSSFLYDPTVDVSGTTSNDTTTATTTATSTITTTNSNTSNDSNDGSLLLLIGILLIIGAILGGIHFFYYKSASSYMLRHKRSKSEDESRELNTLR